MYLGEDPFDVTRLPQDDNGIPFTPELADAMATRDAFFEVELVSGFPPPPYAGDEQHGLRITRRQPLLMDAHVQCVPLSQP
ncbi:MAG: hypothetical protein AAGF12_09535 [Myxococcota bacterium]